MASQISWYQLKIDEVMERLKTKSTGLSEKEAEERIKIFGYNEIKRQKKESPIKILIRQFIDPLIIILIAASVLSYFLGDIIDTIVILVIIVVNGILGFVQEYRAERAIEALKKLAAPKAKVIRDETVKEIDAKFLVPGDIVLLEVGNSVPADMRLMESVNLQINESSLTGESQPASKTAQVLKGHHTLGEQRNMAFMGTIVTAGRGKGIVVATGNNTEIGKIAKFVQEAEEEKTPLERDIEETGKRLGIILLAVTAIVFLFGLSRHTDFVYMLLTSVSLAVAAIPEGLPAVVTITLALGVARMAKQNAIIRKLSSVETLGSTTVIYSDKTGTLTENQMTVKSIYVLDEYFHVTGDGYAPQGDILNTSNEKITSFKASLKYLLLVSALCNNAYLIQKNGEWSIVGDPTEGALLVLAMKAGFSKELLKEDFKDINEFSFDSVRKRMTVVVKNKHTGELLALTKGAPEEVLAISSYIYDGEKIRTITHEDKEKILNANKDMANKAYRVLAFAFKKIEDRRIIYSQKHVEKDLIFLGLTGAIDPPRKEAIEAIKICKKAKIKVAMITGDHALTAQKIAEQLTLYSAGDKILTGKELDSISDDELAEIIDDVKIFARVSPEHKLRIVSAAKMKDHVVAMTGDGVNDAPALKAADIGIAMGISGTDVAKEASDMILADDNFATIVNAIKEGRTIYDNIKKFVTYLLSSNIGEIFVIFSAIMLTLPLPLTPVQILWMNLITDGLPATAIGVDPPGKNVLERPPRDIKEKLLSRNVLMEITIIGILIGIVSLLAFWITLLYYPLEVAQTVTLTLLVCLQMTRVQTIRLKYMNRPFDNKFLILAVLLSLILQLIVVYVPIFQVVFKTRPLDVVNWMVIIIVTISSIIVALVWHKFIRKEAV
ncbi:MAG: calcium-translocating P-type ATPase, SERCA-type [Candidatus Asgardarchaeia archaeon]